MKEGLPKTKSMDEYNDIWLSMIENQSPTLYEWSCSKVWYCTYVHLLQHKLLEQSNYLFHVLPHDIHCQEVSSHELLHKGSWKHEVWNNINEPAALDRIMLMVKTKKDKDLVAGY